MSHNLLLTAIAISLYLLYDIINCTTSTTSNSNLPLIRGIRNKQGIEILHKVQTSTLTCINNTNIKLTLEQINDNYCDCINDGIDEPGTSACSHISNLLFYCPNLGSQSKYIYTSHVNDNICDCCDSSDEYNSNIQCNNTCYDEGQQIINELEIRINNIKQGSILKQNIVQQNKQKLIDLQNTLIDYESKFQERKQALVDAEIIKQQEEAIEQAEKDRLYAIEQEQQRLLDQQNQDNNNTVTTDSIASDILQSVDIDITTGNNIATTQQQQQQRTDQQHVIDTYNQYPTDDTDQNIITNNQVETDNSASESFPYPAEYQFKTESVDDTVVTDDGNNDNNAFPYPTDYAPPANDNNNKNEQSNEFPYPQEYAAPSTDNKQQSQQEEEQDSTVTTDNVLDQSQSEQSTEHVITSANYVTEGANKARDEYNKAQTRVTRMEQEIAELQDKLNRTDYGVDYELLSLDGECYSITQGQYIYEFCPYNKATQKEGHSNVNLGQWKGIEYNSNNDNNNIQFIFDKGQQCWSGPQRSLIVDVICDIEYKILSVDEPSKCVYHAVFTTPLVCNDSDIKQLEQQLHILQYGEDNDVYQDS